MPAASYEQVNGFCLNTILSAVTQDREGLGLPQGKYIVPGQENDDQPDPVLPGGEMNDTVEKSS